MVNSKGAEVGLKASSSHGRSSLLIYDSLVQRCAKTLEIHVEVPFVSIDNLISSIWNKIESNNALKAFRNTDIQKGIKIAIS